MGYFTDTDSVIESYSAWLGLKHPEARERFENLRASNSEGAMAEAVVFRLLQTLQAHPELHESASTGGADFMCSHGRSVFRSKAHYDPFVVEATCLDPDAVTDRSNLPNEISEDNTGGAFGMVTQNIFNKVRDKAPQVANYPMPRVLAISSSHAHISLVFNGAAAQWALISDIHWRHEIGSDKVDPREYTDLRCSIFMKPGPDGSILRRPRR
jgi:hypothetical protein